MAKLLKLRRGTTTQHGSFTGAEGEVTIDTTKDTAVVHDGSQAGGRPLAREDMSNVSSASIAGQLGTDSIAVGKIAAGTLPSDVTVASANLVDGTIVNADVNASAAIAGTKISPDFGSQNISTSGIISTSGNQVTVSGSAPTVRFADAQDTPTYDLTNNNGQFRIRDATNSADRFQIATDGTVDVTGNLDVGAGLDVTGAIATTGNITSSAGEISTTNGSIIANKGTNNQVVLAHDGAIEISRNSGGAFIDFKSDISEDHDARIEENSGGFNISGNVNIANGLDITGNMTVTGTVDGRDVAADGTKLDGIESSATADQTNAEIRAAVEAASDSNVFTDADHTKLNGIESSATADQTASEIASALNGQNVYTTGNIGRDSDDYISFLNGTYMNIHIAGSNEFRFESDGDFHADGDVIAQSTTTASDRRLKENIEVIPNALDKVQALNGVSFDWKKTGEKSAGVIAQEVQEVLPEAVKEVTPVGGGESHLTVNYHALTSILIESIKELKAEIEELKGGE